MGAMKQALLDDMFKEPCYEDAEIDRIGEEVDREEAEIERRISVLKDEYMEEEEDYSGCDPRP